MKNGDIPERLIQEAELLRQRQRDSDRAFKRAEQDKWRVVAGQCFEQMRGSLDEAERQIRSPNGKVRLVALQMLTYHWQARDNVAPYCEELALLDPDVEVRMVALSCLGTCYMNSIDRRIAKVLAERVHDAGESAGLRAVAYFALLGVVGRRDLVAMTTFKEQGCLRFPDDIDEACVRSYLQERVH